MKKIMEMLQNMKAKNEKKDNKGFSLVELIIVIAIMAILVGVVGTQVLPYLNKSKVEKDRQILSSYCTAAVSAYSMVASEISSEPGTIDIYTQSSPTADQTTIINQIKKLTYDDTWANVHKKFKSKEAAATTVTDIEVTYGTDHTVTVTLKGLSTADSDTFKVVSDM